MFLIRHIMFLKEHIFIFLFVILCFLKNIFYFLIRHIMFLKEHIFKRHIFLSVILCFLKNIFFFPNNIYMFSRQHIMLLNLIGHVYDLYPWTTYMWSLCNVFIQPLQTHTPFVALAADQSVVQWAFQFIVCSKHSYRDTVFYLLCTRVSMVALLRNT